MRALIVFISFWAHHVPPGAFFLDLSLASPNVRWRLSRPITSENGLLGQAEDFNLLGHPAEQRGEFYKLKFVGWCVGWLRRVRRVTLLASHQLTCRFLSLRFAPLRFTALRLASLRSVSPLRFAALPPPFTPLES